MGINNTNSESESENKKDLLAEMKNKYLVYSANRNIATGINCYLGGGKLFDVLKHSKKHLQQAKSTIGINLLDQKMFNTMQNKYYYDFCHLFFVDNSPRDTIYTICKRIFSKYIEQLEYKLKENQSAETMSAFHFNAQTGKIDDDFQHILFLFCMAKILHDIFSITRNDFDELSYYDLNKLKDKSKSKNDVSDQIEILANVIDMILEKNLHTKSNVLDYLEKVVHGITEVEMQKFSPDGLSIDDPEKEKRTLMYQRRLVDVASYERKAYNQLDYSIRRKYIDLRKYFKFQEYKPWSRNWHDKFSEYVVEDVWLVYQEELFAMLAEKPEYFCDFGANDYYQLRYYMKQNNDFLSNQRISKSDLVKEDYHPHDLIMAIFKGDRQRFIRFYEDRKSSDNKLILAEAKDRKRWNMLRIIYCCLHIFSSFVMLGIPLAALFSGIVQFGAFGLFLFFAFLFLFVTFVRSSFDMWRKYHIKFLHSTDSETEYTEYLHKCYPILDCKNNSEYGQYTTFLSYRDEIKKYGEQVTAQKQKYDKAYNMFPKTDDINESPSTVHKKQFQNTDAQR